jgi:hypothetical protein
VHQSLHFPASYFPASFRGRPGTGRRNMRAFAVGQVLDKLRHGGLGGKAVIRL